MTLMVSSMLLVEMLSSARASAFRSGSVSDLFRRGEDSAGRGTKGTSMEERRPSMREVTSLELTRVKDIGCKWGGSRTQSRQKTPLHFVAEV